jgi:O-antigen/teichoic acid export membrane protein
MLKILKSSVRDTIIYSIGTFSSKLAGFVLVPLYTNKNFLSASDFGILNLVEANLQFLISVFTLGLNYAFERWYWDKDFISKRKPIFFTIIFSTVGMSMALFAFLAPFSESISGLLFEGAGHASIFKLMLINAGFEIIAQTPNSLIRLNEKPVLFTIANLSKLVTSISFTLLFLVHLHMGLEGVYYAQLTGIAVYFLILSRFILQHVVFQFEWRIVANMIRFRFPFIFPIIALNILNFSDRYIISNLNNVVDSGVYALGAKLANTIKVFLITAIWLSLTPTIYKMMDDPNNKRFYSKVMTYLSFTVIMFVMLFSFFSKELVQLVAREDLYLDAYQVIPLISFGIFFGMLKDVSLIGLNVTKKTRSLAITTILITILNVGLNFLLIPYLGIIGAAVASLLSQFVFFIIIYSTAQKYFAIPYEIRKIQMMVLLALFLFVIASYSNSISIWSRIPIKLMLILSFPYILYWLNFYEPVEIERLKGFWNKWKNPVEWKKNLEGLKF